MKWNKAAALTILLLLLVPLFSVRAQTLGPIYIIQEGDTLTSIAGTFGTTVDEILVLNGIQETTILVPGNSLVIPGFEGVQGVLSTQQIEFGETLESFSQRYGVPEEDLIRLNRILRPDRIYAGQALILTQDENAENQQEASRTLSLMGEGKLAASVREGVNPWSLHNIDGDERLWVIPAEVLLTPQGDDTLSALPDPILSASLYPSPAVQGHTLVVQIDLEQSGWIEGRLDQDQLNFFADSESSMVSLYGIHAMTEPGLYDLEISLYTALGEAPSYSFVQPIRVLDGGYRSESINGVPAETVDPAVINPEQDVVEALLSPATPDRMWDGQFILPSDYYTEEFISVFGTRRNYNFGALYYYHTGLDLYGRTGVEIMATAPGVVVFAGPLAIRGNATYIDHGWGVYSGYFHQSEIFVSEGEMVEAGQVIGLVGNTGRSTGAHLHWEIWVGGVPVDPLDWVLRVFP
jgi:murein DD-endopeptidase MepM/ murein hydrolase activator NlpD